MSWQLLILIAIVAVVLLSIPAFCLVWKVFKRVFGVFDTIQGEVAKPLSVNDPFADLEATVKRMTGPGRDPFGRL